MITKLTKKPNYHELLEFFTENFSYDCYITENNVRLYMTDISNIKKLVRQASAIFELRERGDLKGLVGVWKSVGGGITRYYVKFVASKFKNVKDILTVLLWNFNTDLYVKIRKESPYVSAFKNKNFRFVGGRGCQILLYRKYIPMRPTNEYRNTDDD